MSLEITPADRVYEQQPPDYAMFCLVRDAALRIRDDVPVLPQRLSDDWVEFNAITVSTDLPDNAYAPTCLDLNIKWHRYGRKEELLLEMREGTLGSRASERFHRQFCLRTKLRNVISTWQALYYPDSTGTVHESVSKPEEVLEALEGAALLDSLLKGTHGISMGDCIHMIRELDQFRQGS